MSAFSVIQQRVLTRLIDVPAAVQAEIPTLVNAAQEWLQAHHNFNIMRNEAVYLTTVANHVIGQIPVGWKEPRGNPYYALMIGSVREFDWQPNRTYAYRQWDPFDPNSKGPPRNLLTGEAAFDPAAPDLTMVDLNLEVYPYPDGLSDWTTTPAGEYRVHVPYWGSLPALVNSGDVNWYTENATEYLVDYATALGFQMDWDEQRAGFWEAKALGAKFDEAEMRSLGGWARVAINKDKSIAFAPGRVLIPRRDVYAPRDQWRT